MATGDPLMLSQTSQQGTWCTVGAKHVSEEHSEGAFLVLILGGVPENAQNRRLLPSRAPGEKVQAPRVPGHCRATYETRASNPSSSQGQRLAQESCAPREEGPALPSVRGCPQVRPSASLSPSRPSTAQAPPPAPACPGTRLFTQTPLWSRVSRFIPSFQLKAQTPCLFFQNGTILHSFGATVRVSRQPNFPGEQAKAQGGQCPH